MDSVHLMFVQHTTILKKSAGYHSPLDGTLPASPRWVKICTPGVGTLLELSGDLLGRHEDVYSSESFAPLAIEIHHMEFLSVQQFDAKSADPVSAPQVQSS